MDRLFGDDGNDVLIDRSRDFNDVLDGGDGDDTFDTWDNPAQYGEPDYHPDTVRGGLGTDTFWVDDVDDLPDIVTGEPGEDKSSDLEVAPDSDKPPENSLNKPPVR